MTLDFNMTFLSELFIEIHSKDQSLMNQKWSFENMVSIREYKWHYNNRKAMIYKAVKTKNHDCNVKNSLKTTQCYNNFYMMKLKCYLPWLESYIGPLDKCGSKHYINDLVNLIKLVNYQDSKLTKEIKDFGCSIPNCKNTKWILVDSLEEYHYKQNLSNGMFLFPSSKVKIL